MFLTKTKVLRLPEAFENGSLAIIKLWKTQLPKMAQSGEFLLFMLNSAKTIENL